MRLVKCLLLLTLLLPPAVYADDYERIQAGMSAEEAVQILGEPVDFEKALSKAQLDTVVSSLHQLDNRDSAQFLIWKKSEEMVYVLGINKQLNVAVKHRIFFLGQ